MKKNATIVIFGLAFSTIIFVISCNQKKLNAGYNNSEPQGKSENAIIVDTTKIPNDPFGEAVRYGRQLLLNTAYYIGPDGVKGKYLGNKMNCTNCHQDAGTKAYSFCLISSQNNYPQYRAREGKILSLAERVNNCVMHPHNGKPLPLDGKEMIAILAYLKWINSFAPKDNNFLGAKNMKISFPDTAANSQTGEILFEQNCSRCHGSDGEGKFNIDNSAYIYPPLWGPKGYQPGSSMHRVIKMAQWIKSNMPYDKAYNGKPYLTDEQALDIAAYVNNDDLHKRPTPLSFDYPNIQEKPIDYDHGPFSDSFSEEQHKYGPFNQIINFYKNKGIKTSF